MKIKAHHITEDKDGNPKLRKRFRRSKHKGYCAGAFGKPRK